MKRRDILPYKYRAFTGVVMADCHVDAYNAVQTRINTFLDAGLPVPEHLIHSSNYLLKLFSRCDN